MNKAEIQLFLTGATLLFSSMKVVAQQTVSWSADSLSPKDITSLPSETKPDKWTFDDCVQWACNSSGIPAVLKESPRSRLITVKVENRLMQVKIDSIIYIEVKNDRVIFFRKDSGPLSSLMTLREVEEMLPAEIFMRVHRSFIVNIPSVEIVERNRIVFGKTYIPISENKREEFFSRLGK